MAQFSILLADLKVYNHRRGLSSEFWAMARFNTTAARANHRLHMVFGHGTLVLREDCVAELNNYIDPLPNNFPHKNTLFDDVHMRTFNYRACIGHINVKRNPKVIHPCQLRQVILEGWESPDFPHDSSPLKLTHSEIFEGM
ncbi:hypothetical protein Bca101_003367 [Brassica carinata]